MFDEITKDSIRKPGLFWIFLCGAVGYCWAVLKKSFIVTIVSLLSCAKVSD